MFCNLLVIEKIKSSYFKGQYLQKRVTYTLYNIYEYTFKFFFLNDYTIPNYKTYLKKPVYHKIF